MILAEIERTIFGTKTGSRFKTLIMVLFVSSKKDKDQSVSK